MAYTDIDLTGTIDLHIHTAPDVRPRKLDDLETARQAAARGMRAIVLKSHWALTAERATLAQGQVTGLRVFGGLALNETVGGFNPAAVELALRLGAAEVWLPTLSAAGEAGLRRPGDLTVADEQGRLRPALQEIFALVAEHDAILGTGHISPAEIMQVVPAARAAGVRKIVITHPEHPPVLMPPAQQETLRAEFDVLFERCLISTVPGSGHLKFAELAAVIRRVGYESTVISTDLGQLENALPVDGMAEYIGRLREEGFDAASIDRMARQNGAWLLGL